eukprot:7138811-Pyramimonas_sp.AAC.1
MTILTRRTRTRATPSSRPCPPLQAARLSWPRTRSLAYMSYVDLRVSWRRLSPVLRSSSYIMYSSRLYSYPIPVLPS